MSLPLIQLNVKTLIKKEDKACFIAPFDLPVGVYELRQIVTPAQPEPKGFSVIDSIMMHSPNRDNWAYMDEYDSM